VAIDESQIQREKDRLPHGWGRFGKALTHLGEVAQPDESLLSSCIGINPQFKIGGSLTEPTAGLAAGAVAGRMAGIAKAATKDTNLLLAATDKRIIAMATGLKGATPGTTHPFRTRGLRSRPSKRKRSHCAGPRDHFSSAASTRSSCPASSKRSERTPSRQAEPARPSLDASRGPEDR
jgi:hypothetical protein